MAQRSFSQKSSFSLIQLTESGGFLMSYEKHHISFFILDVRELRAPGVYLTTETRYNCYIFFSFLLNYFPFKIPILSVSF